MSSPRTSLILFVAGVAMIGGAYVWFKHETAARAVMPRAEAKIVDNRATEVCVTRSGNGCEHHETKYHPIFEFDVGGHALRVEHPVFSSDQRPVGSVVTVRYDPTNPKDAEIDAPEVPPGWPFALGAVALVPLFLGTRGLWRLIVRRGS
jgi:hypothetical protein